MLCAVFGLSFDRPLNFSYLLLVRHVWIALSSRLGDTTAAILAINVGATVLASITGFELRGILELQLLMMLLSLTGLILGVLKTKRNETELVQTSN